MQKNRFEAFSDGVIAIIITIMVLEIKVPHGTTFAALEPLSLKFLSYALSFVNVGIYWNNHHHMIHSVDRISGKILWANLHFLFWLSLMPFGTAWIGESRFAPAPVFCYGIDLIMCAISYFILQNAIIQHQGPESLLKKAIGADYKGRTSLGTYAVGIALSLFAPLVAMGLYICVAIMWFIPDRRTEGNV